MTLNNDIILKSWLRSLRYTTEYYEDTFDSRNNRKCGNNRSSAKKMIVGGETNEESDDERYVNIWECRDREKSASKKLKIKNFLESVGEISELSIIEGDNSSVSFNTQSESDLNVKSCLLDSTQSKRLSFDDPSVERSKITDLDKDLIVKKPRKPKVTPRLSKISNRNEALYENLFVRTQNDESVLPENSHRRLKENEKKSENSSIYQNIPLKPQKRSIYSINIEESSQNSFDNPPIYVNLPLFPQSRKDSQDSLSDESNFEEKVCSTIQYLENILDSVSIESFSDSTDSDVEECKTPRNFDSAATYGSDVASVNSKTEEDCAGLVENIDEEKFTESSSSFGEYVTREHLNLSEYRAREVEPQNFNQRFAKDNRVSAFFEEQEPLLPQEVKDIPIPKKRAGIFVPRNRCSVPIDLRKLVNTGLDVRRPQSLQSAGFEAGNIEEFENFKEYLKRRSLESSRVSIDGLHPKKLEITEGHSQATDIFEEFLRGKGVSFSNVHIEETDDCDSLKKIRVKEIEDSKTKNLNIHFAKESRLSTFFEDVLQELEVFEVETENIILEEKQFFEYLTGDVVMWMADLMEDYCCEKLDFMEEKELLQSINQIPKERFERPPENKFPLVDDHVEIRRNQSIQRNRVSKTTDFDLGWRKQDSATNTKNFDIPGIVKFQLPNNNTIITKLNQEYVAYENEIFYRVTKKTKAKVPLAQNIVVKSARYLNSRSKESKEVELKDTQNLSYILYFDSIKSAKQFMDNERVQVYVTDNKVTIKKTLLRFLGKRSSREILEKKGIYKNEPIFGNTLRDIYTKNAASGSVVPLFVCRVIELIERLENIKSLGLYRTSGNLATIQKIRFEVDNGRLEILDQFCKDPDVLTGSFKLFFRELKEPLISCDVCEKLIEVTKLDPKQLSSKDHQKIKSTLMKNMHEANLETFYVVMRHLLNVVKYKEFNKMDTYNLSVCWGPSMIFSVHGASTNATFESKDIVTQSHDATRLVDFLLSYYELYPSELDALSKKPESVTEKILALKRQESRDSVASSDSSKSQKKSSSNLSLSIDEITRKLVEIIEPNLSTEGLYKKPGSPDKTNKLIKKLNKKKINELDKHKTEVHEMTDALKRYLREQEGLVSKEIIDLVLRATSDNHYSQNYLEPLTRRKVTSLIEETPKKDTLIYILRHLAKVIDHQSRHKVSKSDIIGIWTDVLDYQWKCQVSYAEFSKFLTVAVEVFNDNLPDIVRSSVNNNGGSPNRNEIMGEVVKQIKNQQERDRNSRYDNVDCDVSGEASLLEDKTEQTKL